MSKYEWPERDAQIEARYRSGETQAAIAASLVPPVSKMRISQILKRRGVSKRHGGAHMRRKQLMKVNGSSPGSQSDLAASTATGV